MRAMSDPFVFDRTALRMRRDRAAEGLPRVAGLLDEVAERLTETLDAVRRPFSRALDLGGRGAVAPRLRARGIEVIEAALSPRQAVAAAAPALVVDEEVLPFAPASFDLIVASLSLHWINDLPGALIQLRRSLRPDGLFLASLPIVGTLGELRAVLTEAEAELTGGASPRVAPFPDLRDCAGLLQRAGFAMPVAERDEIRLRYADPVALLRDLRDAGETNALRLRERRFAPRALFPMALSRLPAEDGRITATLRLALLTGWAPG